MSSRVLVTGGAGFIGANLVQLLQSKGNVVTVFDNLSNGRIEYLSDPSMVTYGDIRDRAVLSNAMAGMDAVVHLAAQGSVVESVASPSPNFDINVGGVFSALDCARKSRVRRFVFASTGGALIGDAVPPPVTELSLPKPISPYGASKLCGEAYCQAFGKAYGMSTVVLRFANVYGPYSGHKKGAVTTFMKCIFQHQSMPIFGDGSSSRDYLHVADLCDGISRALVADVAPGEVFHLASGKETSILTLAQMVADVAGVPDHPVVHLPRRRGEVERNFARYAKAGQVLGFTPSRSLKGGLSDTWRWFVDHRADLLVQPESESQAD